MSTLNRQGATSLREQRIRRVRDAFRELPGRYLGAERDFDATFQIRIGDVGRSWEVRTQTNSCVVRQSPSREPDVVIGTDAQTWLALRAGRISGLDAFSQRRLYARGDLDLAVGFEGMFHLPGDRDPLLRISEVQISGGKLSTLIAGDGPEQVICVHGLGANKASFFETVSALSPGHTVHAIDLPGFGSSSKPARGAYNAPWFGAAVRSYMDAMAIEKAHLVGNSMGGRIALEVAFRAPERVNSLSLLAPSMAWTRGRQFAPLVRLLRPELASIPHPLRAATVKTHFWGMFARPENLDPTVADIAADEFCRTYRSRAARVAFFASLRNIYLDEPYGEDGFWSRLAALEPEALFIWGDADKLVPAGFSRHVREALPGASQEILAACGHVPQVELAERTNRLIGEHIAGAARPRRQPTARGQLSTRLARSRRG